MENRDTCIFYRSYYEAIKDLPKDIQADIYNAIFDYSLNFNDPELTGLAHTIFTLIKPILSKGNKNYINGKQPKLKPLKSEIEANLEPTESEEQAYKYKYKYKDNKDKKESKEVKAPSFKLMDDIEFKKQLTPLTKEYGKEMILAFHAYWAEPLANGKMRLTAEKAWDLNRRLKTWQSRNTIAGFNNNQSKQIPFSRAANGSLYVGDEIINK